MKPEILKVEGHDDLVRVGKFGPVVMSDSQKYEEYMATYNSLKERKLREQETTEQRFQKLEQGMSEIQELLRQTLGALNART